MAKELIGIDTTKICYRFSCMGYDIEDSGCHEVDCILGSDDCTVVFADDTDTLIDYADNEVWHETLTTLVHESRVSRVYVCSETDADLVEVLQRECDLYNDCFNLTAC